MGARIKYTRMPHTRTSKQLLSAWQWPPSATNARDPRLRLRSRVVTASKLKILCMITDHETRSGISALAQQLVRKLFNVATEWRSRVDTVDPCDAHQSRGRQGPRLVKVPSQSPLARLPNIAFMWAAPNSSSNRISVPQASTAIVTNAGPSPASPGTRESFMPAHLYVLVIRTSI